MSKTVVLFRQGGETSIHINARIEEAGDLLLSGQDIGEAPQQIFGKDEYEYWLRVPAAAKDRMLLALIEKIYRGNASVMSELKEFLESKEIPCEFHTF